MSRIYRIVRAAMTPNAALDWRPVLSPGRTAMLMALLFDLTLSLTGDQNAALGVAF